MSELDNVLFGHHRLPILTHDKFADWEIAIISFLTKASDHVHMIEQRTDAKGTLVDPARPTTPDAECSQVGCVGTRSVGCYHDDDLQASPRNNHCADKKPFYQDIQDMQFAPVPGCFAPTLGLDGILLHA